MNRTLHKTIGIILLAVFAFFHCGNSVFMHTHSVNGLTIVHSHPYHPYSQHSHTQHALDTIAALNAALLSMETSRQEYINKPHTYSILLECVRTVFLHSLHIYTQQLRAPPHHGYILACTRLTGCKTIYINRFHH